MAEIALTFLSPVIEEAISKIFSFVRERIGNALGLEEKLNKLRSSLNLIQSLLQRAEQRQENDPAIRDWLQNLEKVAYKALIVLDECEYKVLKHKVKNRGQLLKPVIFSPKFRSHMTSEIKHITDELDYLQGLAPMINLVVTFSGQTCPMQYQKTDSFPDNSKVIGRAGDVSRIVNLLLNLRSSQHKISGISIVGMAGVGKTTVARSLYKKAKEEKLYDLMAWVCVSEDFNDHIILVEMLEHFGSSAAPRNSMNALLEGLAIVLENKTFLLILDDVWNDNPKKWDSFTSRLSKILKTSGSSIVATTRSGKVASVMESIPMQSYKMQGLSDNECWLIIKEKFLRSSIETTSMPPDLEAIGQDIAKKCGGLPLVATVIGGTLSHQADADTWEAIKNDEAWNFNSGNGDEILSILKISFDRLPSPLKKCFSYCAIFPKDFVIEKDDLVQLWMAAGFLQQSNESFNTMEDIVFVSKGEVLIWEESGCNIVDNSNVRHLRIKSERKACPTIPRDVLKGLHSLFSSVHAFTRMASDLKSLRSLKLVEDDTKYLPNYLCKSKHLRYVDISRTEFNVLSRSFNKLFNLQTLRLMGWPHLLKLPKDMKNLGLKFTWSAQKEANNNLNNEEVLEGLKPHPNLKSLIIQHYQGKNYPSWVQGGVNSSLNNLTKLELRYCNECLYLPSLGLLRNLQFLKIVGIEKVKGMGSKFHLDQSNNNDGVVSATQFPALREFSVVNMESLEEWVEVEGMTVFPCLEKLNIDNCPVLKTWLMDGFSSNHKLSSLRISRCHKMMAIPSVDGLSSLKTLSIEECHELMSVPNGLGSCISLQQLEICKCQKLSSVININRLTSLTRLELSNCDELTDLPIGLGSCSSLQHLRIWNCHNIISFTEDARGLHSRSQLEIRNCRKLRSIPEECVGRLTYLKSLWIGGFWSELEEFPRLTFIHQLHASLEDLCLFGWDKLKSLPHQLQYLTALKRLLLRDFNGLEALPEWLGDLSSLHELQIGYCSNLTHLPSIEAMRRLSNLQSLEIWRSPKLEERCAKERGPEWAKISHIPKIMINWMHLQQQSE
ncbi:hypothetical protein SLEP1_g14654 [Rubroshorea leprosula]|uniref:Uncharacterized protein n=1 Tax=Rubroshorea leprosula TaxID=152421 RepID=A0AAV5IJW7_9ROSI|nr:hypothetical protein SLEP1_g14654 [Rubroshorea leprosula]